MGPDHYGIYPIGYSSSFHVTSVVFPVVNDDEICDLIDAGHRVLLLRAHHNGNQLSVVTRQGVCLQPTAGTAGNR